MFVAIAGNIGAGKSSLTSILHETFGWQPYFESVDDNPYLEDFYGDMTRWSFHLQVYFLSQRFATHQQITTSGIDVVQDRSIYEDAEIFARNLHDMGRMDDRDYTNYTALYGVMTGFLHPPDLLLYLRAGTPTLLRQIQRRGRSFEKGIEPAYLDRLNQLYDAWIARYTLGPVITIDVDDTDFVHNEQERADLLYRIDHAARAHR